MALRSLSDLDPNEFENLTYDLVQAAGLRNLVWRTPGADGGRDIEGEYHYVDFSGARCIQKWHVECKRYTNAIDWPTVWQKIAHADSLRADVLLLVTNNNPSPACETHIAQWNAQRRDLKVRVWRGYELSEILGAYPAVALKFGLLDAKLPIDPKFSGLIAEIMKAAQASYATLEFGQDPRRSVEMAAALAELTSARMAEIDNYGRIVHSQDSTAPPDYDWVKWQGPAAGWDSVGLRAILTTLRHYLTASELTVAGEDTRAVLTSTGHKLPATETTHRHLSEIAFWSNIEIESFDVTGGLDAGDMHATVTIRKIK